MNGAECWLTLDKAGFRAVWLLLSVLWQSSILLAAAGLLAYVLRRRRASVRHAVLAAAILAAPLVPLLGWAASRSAAPRVPIPVMPTYSAPVLTAETAEAAPPVALPPEAVTPAPVLTEAPAAPQIDQAPVAQADRAQPQERPLPLLNCPWALVLLAYATGAAGLLCLVAIGRYRIGMWARRGRVVTDPRVLGIFRLARARLGLDRDFTVVESRRTFSPLTVGTLHPIVLLPGGLARDSSDEDLLAVALHELAHVRRCDSLLLTLLSLVRAALFFHPLVWLACRQVSALAESACDDAVLDATGRPVPYAKMLARLAEQLPRHVPVTELAAGIVWSKGAFLRRVEAILSDRRDRICQLSRVALVGTLIAAAASISVALALPLGEKNEAQAAAPPAVRQGSPQAPNGASTRPAERVITDAELLRLWDDLGAKDRAKADQAVKAMVALSDRAVTFLRSQLLPQPEDPQKMKKLISDLNDNQFKVRRRAQAELVRIGRAALPALRETLERPDLPLEPRERIKELLTRFADPPEDSPEARRIYRALGAAKRIGTDSAKQMLIDIARGHSQERAARAAREMVRPWAYSEFEEASRFLREGGQRPLAAKRFLSVAGRFPGLRQGPVARELGGMLLAMAAEDAKFREPDNPAGLSEQERIACLVFKLRDVRERSLDVPAKVRVLFCPTTPNSPAAALRKMGKAAVPALLGLLDDHRPTRSGDEGLNGDHVLRYCDVALQILEALAVREFDKPRGRGRYLGNADKDTAEAIKQNVRTWWRDNKDRTEQQWIRRGLSDGGVGAWWGRLATAERLIELEGPRCIDFFRRRLAAEPDSGHLVRLLWRAGGKAVLQDMRRATSANSLYVRAAAYRALLEVAEPGIVEMVVKDIERVPHTADRDHRKTLLAALAYSGQKQAVVAAARHIRNTSPAIADAALQTVLNAASREGFSPELAAAIVPYVASALGDGRLSPDRRYWAASWMIKTAKLTHLDADAKSPKQRAEIVRQVQAWWRERRGEYPESKRTPSTSAAVRQGSPQAPNGAPAQPGPR